MPGHGGFHRIAGPPEIQIGRQAQSGHLFHRLVGGAVLAHADGVVGKGPDYPQSHDGRQAHGVFGLIRKGHEGARIRDEAAVQGQAVHDRAHAELAHAVGNVVAGVRAGLEVL